jgi:hypothetical protein
MPTVPCVLPQLSLPRLPQLEISLVRLTVKNQRIDASNALIRLISLDTSDSFPSRPDLKN